MIYFIGYLVVAGIVFYLSMCGFNKYGGNYCGDDFEIVMPSILIAAFWPLTIWFTVAYFLYKYLERKK